MIQDKKNTKVNECWGGVRCYIGITRGYNLAFVYLVVNLISFEDSDRDFDIDFDRDFDASFDLKFRLDNIIIVQTAVL